MPPELQLSTPWQRKHLQMACTSPECQAIADEVEDWCADVYLNKAGIKRWLVLSGSSGTGKTHVAKALANWFRGVSSQAVSFWYKFPSQDYRIWSPCVAVDSPREWQEVLRSLTEPDFLVVDDLGSETDRYRTDEPKERLRQLLSAREHKWTVATTNVLPADYAKVWDSRVEDRFYRCSKRLKFEKLCSYAVWRETQKGSH